MAAASRRPVAEARRPNRDIQPSIALNFDTRIDKLRALPVEAVRMIEFFLKIIFFICAGLVLTMATVWYVTSVYEAVTGRSELVIVPFTIAGVADDKSGRSEALAKMLHARLGQIEHDLTISQKLLVGGVTAATAPTDAGAATQAPKEAVTSIAPPLLFVTQGVTLQTRLLEPAQLKVTVGGVDVGGLLPWFQRLLITRR